MTMSDPIADMLTRIRNANTAKHDTVDYSGIQNENFHCRYSVKRRLYCQI